jgi:hypothetical protein
MVAASAMPARSRLTALVPAFLLLAAPAAAAAPEPPQENLWISYAASFASGGTTPTPGNPEVAMVTHGHGYAPVFAIRLVEANGGRLAALVRSPRNFDRNALHVRDTDAGDRGEDRHGLAEAAHERLEAGIDHHRPPTTFLLSAAGRIAVRKSASALTFERCARRLIRQSSQRLMQAAQTPPLRERERERHSVRMERAEQARRAPSLFLQLLKIQLRPVTGGRWAEFERQQAGQGGAADRPNQYRWRSEQIRRHGREAALEIDLMTDRRSPAARLCRSRPIRSMEQPARDSCRIDAFLDARDGWPIVLGVSRTVEAPGEGTASWTATFYRLAPLEGFAAPPNPCAAAVAG